MRSLVLLALTLIVLGSCGKKDEVSNAGQRPGGTSAPTGPARALHQEVESAQVKLGLFKVSDDKLIFVSVDLGMYVFDKVAGEFQSRYHGDLAHLGHELSEGVFTQGTFRGVRMSDAEIAALPEKIRIVSELNRAAFELAKRLALFNLRLQLAIRRSDDGTTRPIAFSRNQIEVVNLILGNVDAFVAQVRQITLREMDKVEMNDYTNSNFYFRNASATRTQSWFYIPAGLSFGGADLATALRGSRLRPLIDDFSGPHT